MTDLVLHLSMVHRSVARVVGERMQQPPACGDRSWLGLAEEWAGWLLPGRAPRKTGRLDVRGESSLLERYFVLVPPI
jgi:hypothetical protein